MNSCNVGDGENQVVESNSDVENDKKLADLDQPSLPVSDCAEEGVCVSDNVLSEQDRERFRPRSESPEIPTSTSLAATTQPSVATIRCNDVTNDVAIDKLKTRAALRKASVSAAAFAKPSTASSCSVSQQHSNDKRRSINEFLLPTTPKCVRRKRHARAAQSKLAILSSDDEDDYSAAFRSKATKVRRKMTSSESHTNSMSRPPRHPTASDPRPSTEELLQDCK